MNSKYNFDLFLRKEKPLAKLESDILKKAALIYTIDLQKDFEEFSPTDIELLKKKIFKREDGTYGLLKEDRLKIIKTSIGLENIESTIEKLKVASSFSKVLKMIFYGKRLEPNKLSNEQIFYAIILSDLFPNKLDRNELKGVYQRRQFFKQFERVTKNFAGRKKELERVNDYVDWLPKSNLLNTINSVVRNIINWHEKPPLLIKGIGGIGKSTIVAKFIMEQNNKKTNDALPFVYIDFDLPGFTLKEPMTVLIEALRQINIQYPKHKGLVDRISEQISSLIHNSDDEKMMKQSTSRTTRNYIYKSIEEIIKNNNLNFKRIGRNPILIIFDSFEEMQYRASATELFTFYKFIQEVSEKLPRIRPIFVGRSELYIDDDNIEFDTLEIKEFDAESADALLKKTGIAEQEIRNFIYSNFGGNPLMLTLATDLAKKGALDFKDKEKIKTQKWQYLINRILGHIHDDDVRKIAIPGMLVRSISTDVIQDVLAGPTKLGFIGEGRSNAIYEELRKEVALISKSNDGRSFSFRQDLRMTCESMILTKYPEESNEIRKNAIDYYSNYQSIEDPEEQKKHQAEYFFHLMKNEKIPNELDADTYIKLRPYLEYSIIELPASSRRYIDALNNQNSSIESTQDVTINDADWELYNLGLVKDALNGEFAFLEDVYEQLRKKRNRSNNGFSEFGKYEALIYQRLNKTQLSGEFINRALKAKEVTKNRELEFEFKLIQIQNLEYEERYGDALNLCDEIKMQSLKMTMANQKKYEFLLFRNENRLEFNKPVNNFQEFVSVEYDFNREDDFIDTKWEFIFNKLTLDNIRFIKHYELSSEFKTLKKELNNLNALEGFAKRNMDYFLKDITNTGHFDIVLRDVLFVKEIIDSNFNLS